MMAGTQPPSSSTSRGREDYLESSDYFMAVACLAAQRSKDPSTQGHQGLEAGSQSEGETGGDQQVGACIVNQEGKIVGIGHNMMPNGCDGELPWSRDAADKLDTKYLYVCHAELNAMMNKNSADVKGCTMYVTLFPCNECTKLIIQAGIREVVYLSDKYHDTPEVEASKKMLCYAGIPYRQFQFMRTEIVIDFNSFNPTQGAVSKRKRLT